MINLDCSSILKRVTTDNLPPVTGSSCRYPLFCSALVCLTIQSEEETPGVSTFRQKLEGGTTVDAGGRTLVALGAALASGDDGESDKSVVLDTAGVGIVSAETEDIDTLDSALLEIAGVTVGSVGDGTEEAENSVLEDTTELGVTSTSIEDGDAEASVLVVAEVLGVVSVSNKLEVEELDTVAGSSLELTVVPSGHAPPVNNPNSIRKSFSVFVVKSSVPKR
jgi:hypothetical protein